MSYHLIAFRNLGFLMTSSGMRIGDIGAMISNINNIQVALNSSAGAALMVDLRMRLIGELSNP